MEDTDQRNRRVEKASEVGQDPRRAVKPMMSMKMTMTTKTTKMTTTICGEK
jgi:hypothetical protein